MTADRPRLQRASEPVAHGSDGGFSLVELLVYIVLSALAMAVLGGIMLNGLRTQKNVQSIGAATSTASIIARSVEQGIGNASGSGSSTVAFSVSAATSSGQLLRARTASGASAGTATWTCRAWYYSASNSSFYTTSSTTGAVAAPANTAALASWTRLGTGIAVPSGQTAFTATSDALLKLSLTVSSTGSQPVVISTTEQATTSDSTGAPTTCF